MDKRELNKKLKPFFDACKKEGYDFSKVYLIENLEGVPRAGYHLYFKADWINDRTICDNLIDHLTDIFVKTINDIEIRKMIHYFTVLNKKAIQHCWDYPLVYEAKETV